MHRCLLTCCLIIFLALVPIAAKATTVLGGSSGNAVDPNETNSTGLPTLLIDPNPSWDLTPLDGFGWVSYGLTGNSSDAGFFSPANGTHVTFSDSFTIASLPAGTKVYLTFEADDTGSATINGVLAISAATMAGNTYTTCSDFQPTCGTKDTVDITSLVNVGLNTASFNIEQDNKGSFGTRYDITASAATPEPATIGIVGLALFGLGLVRRKASKT